MTTSVETMPVTLEFPKDGETIKSPAYTFRLGVAREAAAEIAKVEVSIDKGAPRPCRAAVGYFWYDWAGYQPGRHQVVALLTLRNGQTVLSSPRKFQVELDGQRKA